MVQTTSWIIRACGSPLTLGGPSSLCLGRTQGEGNGPRWHSEPGRYCQATAMRGPVGCQRSPPPCEAHKVGPFWRWDITYLCEPLDSACKAFCFLVPSTVSNPVHFRGMRNQAHHKNSFRIFLLSLNKCIFNYR